MLFIVFCLIQPAYGASEQVRIFVVSSYHWEYLWSQDTHNGVCQALLDFGFLENEEQVAAYTQNNYVESANAVVKKAWMDTKRKNSKEDMAAATGRIVAEIEEFQPDLILLGDDNATNYNRSALLNAAISTGRADEALRGSWGSSPKIFYTLS